MELRSKDYSPFDLDHRLVYFQRAHFDLRGISEYIPQVQLRHLITK